jgi:ubiquinol-cytochrome c reductase cytochrome b subunit
MADSAAPKSRLRAWLDHRTGIDSLLRHALDEPIPGGAKIAYVFGSGLLFLFLSQIVTGVFLAMYYVPSADHAHTTVAYITKEVTGGSFLRSIHAYGSSAIIIVLLLHIIQTFMYGSYKGRRELVWIAGCVLLTLMLGMAFTGYLLPWDQKAYFATTVGTNILSEIPWVGNGIKELLRGGTEMGTLTVSRFFMLHVFLIPAFIFAFVAMHVYSFRKAGAAGPVTEDPIAPKLPTEPFYPKQLVMDMGFAVLIIVLLGFLAYLWPTELGPKSDPSDTQFLPRPEWYYVPIFQYLKYWQGSTALLGILVIPGILGLLLVGLPFFDRSLERRPWKRPISVGLFTVVLLGLGALGMISHRGDMRNPGVAAQLKAQREATKEFMNTKFEPELSRGSLVAQNTELANPEAAKGKDIFQAQACNACHGDEGVGTAAAPKLTGIGAKYDAAKLQALLLHSTPKMTAGGMPIPALKDDQMKQLIAYLQSLK